MRELHGRVWRFSRWTIGVADSFLCGALDWTALFFSSTAFTGFLPILVGRRGKWGGTVGSVVGLLLLYMLSGVEGFITWNLCQTVLVAVPAGTYMIFCGERSMLEKWGPRYRHTGDLVKEDFNETNLDEVVGMFTGAVFIWHWHTSPYFVLLLLALFGIFRYLDIKKPGPIEWVERLFQDGPLAPISIMFDDVVGGAIAGFVLMAVVWSLHTLAS